MRTGMFMLLAGTAALMALAFAAPAPAHGCTSPYCPSHRLKVNKGGNGDGTVTSSPAGIACGATCQADYEEGTKVTLTASAASGSSFDGWAGAGCSGTGACVVTIEHNTTVTAIFHSHPSHPPHPPHPRVHVKATPHGAAHCAVFLPQPGKIKVWGPSVRAAYVNARTKGKHEVVLRPKGRVRQHLHNHGWTRPKRIFVIYIQGSTRTKTSSLVRFRDRRHSR